jgi:hypothetical protein
VDRVEALQRNGQRIRLMKRERIPRLGLAVDADHLEAGPVIADRRPARPAEEIQ